MRKWDKKNQKENVGLDAIVAVNLPTWRIPQQITIGGIGDLLQIEIGGVSQAYVDGSLAVIDLYNIIQDTSHYWDIARIDASIARIDASLGSGTSGVSQDYVDGSISTAVYAVDSSLVTYVDAYNLIQDTSVYWDVDRIDASIARIDAYQLIQDNSIAAFEANDVTFADVSTSVALGVDAVDTSLVNYTDAQISSAVDAVDSSLVTYVDAYNILQDTSLYNLETDLDGSLLLYETKLNINSSFGLYETKTNLDSSFGLYQTNANLIVYQTIQDTSLYNVNNSLILTDTSLYNVNNSLLLTDTSLYNLEINLDSSLLDVWAKFDYVDTSLNNIWIEIDDLDSSLGLYVEKTGDTMTGDLTMTDASIIVTGNVEIDGNLVATTKSFLIKHPTKEGKKLQYGSVESPEHSVLHRGHIMNTNIIKLPKYWTSLVRKETVTVQLTPNKKLQILYVKNISKNKITIGKIGFRKIDCFYLVSGERKDIEKLQIERE